MKTKEDILDELTEGRKGLFNDDVQVSFDDSIKAMQEYADQQTEQLKKQLEEKEKEVEKIKEKLDNQQNKNLDLGTELLSLQSQLSEKDKEIEKLKGIINELQNYKSEVLDLTIELSELKAKHKEDVINAFKTAWDESDIFDCEKRSEQYYTQTHGQ